MECVECVKEEKLDVELEVYTRLGFNSTSVGAGLNCTLSFYQSGAWICVFQTVLEANKCSYRLFINVVVSASFSG